MNYKVALSIICVLIFCVVSIGIFDAYMGSKQDVSITVEDKWVKYHGNDAKYLIKDDVAGVLCIEDTILFMEFDSSDKFSNLNIGSSYNVTIVGWRVPVLSMYPNIICLEY